MKRVAYGKLGRVIEIDPAKWGESGGDNEPPALLLTLADRHPDVEWVMVAKNSGWTPPRSNITNPWQDWTPYIRGYAQELYRVQDQSWETYFRTISFYDELINPMYETFDGVVLWCGQHGTSNSPIPKIKDRTIWTKAQISMVHYSGHIVRGVNRFRMQDPVGREEVWLLPDARNYIKGRDLKWPRQHPILCQFDWSRNEHCERYGDTRTPDEFGFTNATQGNGVWKVKDTYIGSGLELVGIPQPKPLSDQPGWEERDRFGILINEARNYGMRPELTRLHAMQHYVLPLEPDWVYGTWTADSLKTMGRDIKPLPYEQIFDRMATTKSTFTTPSSGSGWATAKPWESFGQGIICFFHPLYDTQGHIIPTTEQIRDLPDSELRMFYQWLRTDTPEQLARRVEAVHTSRETYEWLAEMQWRYLDSELEAQRCVRTIESRLGIALC